MCTPRVGPPPPHVGAFFLCDLTSTTDMEKFPVRMKDNDILVTQLFEDPFKEPITALGIYLTPNVCKFLLQKGLMQRCGQVGSVRFVTMCSCKDI